MHTRKFSRGIFLALFGLTILLGCSTPTTPVPTAMPTVAIQPTIAPSPIPPTDVPTAAPPTLAPSRIPSVVVPASTATAQASSKSIVEYVTELTSDKEPFSAPETGVFDAQGNLYVLEGSDQILKFDKAGNFVTKWGSHGSGDGQFNFGWGGDIAIDSNGTLYVSDSFNKRIQMFDLNGKFLSKWGKAGSGDGELANGPGGIAVDSKGNVYVGEGNKDPNGNDMIPGYKENIQVFDSNGKFIAKWEIPGDGLGLIHVPTDIEIDSNDNVYVASQYSDWINKFDTHGKSLGGWNTCGASSDAMDPTGLAIDKQNNIYVGNLASRKICKYTSDGKFLGSWGSFGYGEGEFATMVDLTVNDNGIIYVPDLEKNQILVFKPTQTTVTTQTTVPAPATAAPLTFEPTRSASQITADLNAFFEQYSKARPFSGIVSVARNGESVYEKSFGTTKLEPTVPLTPDSKFRIGSVSKLFTAAAILKLQAQGKLNVQAHYCEYVQPCPKGWEQVTIHHLLTHTAGMPSVDIDIEKPHTAAELAAQIQKSPLEFDPGSQFSYSNIGYIILSALIEQLSGKTYETFLRENFFEPLGMKDTGMTIDDAQLAGDKLPFDESNFLGAGALYSTASDLARWAHALDVWQRDPKSDYQTMFHPYAIEEDGISQYGYGTEIGKKDGHSYFGHGGGLEEYGTFVYLYPDADMTIIILSNNTEGDAVGVIGGVIAKITYKGR